ncbi:MAG TPA: nuclear transport factor 2 family protein [Edaphobacter sp.]|nr:nuclear transport factor 2 family protein [Edaphobacter sp.]
MKRSRMVLQLFLALFLPTGLLGSGLLGTGRVQGQQAEQHGEANVSGTWIGSFDISDKDGKVQYDTAFFQLAQSGTTLTGSAGANEHQLTVITDGRVSGQDVHFAMPVHGANIYFDLRLEGDKLRGAVTGAMAEGGRHIAVDVVREKPIAEGGGNDKVLFDEISRQDTALFRAFNDRDLKTLQDFFTTDVEFYHDKEGRTGYEQNIEAFRTHFASDDRVRRELVPGTLEVYPITGFGAVELGVHRFYTTEKGQPERVTATSRFVHLWQFKDGRWRIARVISYDHR